VVLFKLSQLGLDNLPFSLCDLVLTLAIAAWPYRGSFGFLRTAWVVVPIMLPEGSFELDEVCMLSEANFIRFFDMLLSSLQLLLQSLELFLQLRYAFLDILIFIYVQFLFLLFFDVLYILQFFLQLLNSDVFAPDLILEHV
jgi:hypothetical protein